MLCVLYKSLIIFRQRNVSSDLVGLCRAPEVHGFCELGTARWVQSTRAPKVTVNNHIFIRLESI